MGNKTSKWVQLALTHLFLIALIIAVLFPVLWVFSTSLRQANSLYTTTLQLIPEGATLNNYRTVLFKYPFFLWLWNSFKIAVLATLSGMSLGIPAAYAYSRFRFLGRQAGLNSLLLLNAFPGTMNAIALYLLMTKFKLVNTHLGLIIIYAAGSLVFTIWNMKGYFDTIPREIEEAALVDGATRNQIFWHIMLPLSKPALAVTAIFAVMGPWNDWFLPSIFLTTKDKATLSLGLWGFSTTQYSSNWPLFSAGSILVAIPVVILFLSLQRYLISGLTMGGVKG